MPEAQEALKEDNIMVDLDTSGKAIDVELKDAKEEEKAEVEVKEQPAKEEKKDEREEYSDGVKKRIDRLTYKIREAERREKEALNFAEQIKKERDDLQTKVTKLDDGYVNEFSRSCKI
jgi:chromosome segregation ATPase